MKRLSYYNIRPIEGNNDDNDDDDNDDDDDEKENESGGKKRKRWREWGTCYDKIRCT